MFGKLRKGLKVSLLVLLSEYEWVENTTTNFYLDKIHTLEKRVLNEIKICL